MMSTKGQAIRVAMKEIPTLGRVAQGVRIMKMSEGDTVASIGIVLPEENTNADAGSENAKTAAESGSKASSK